MVPFCPVLPKCQTGTAAAQVRKKTPTMTKPAVLMLKAAFLGAACDCRVGAEGYSRCL